MTLYVRPLTTRCVPGISEERRTADAVRGMRTPVLPALGNAPVGGGGVGGGVFGCGIVAVS